MRAHRKGVRKAEERRAQGKVELHEAGPRYNGYQCSPSGGCGAIFLTIDIDKGTTPMFLKCISTPGCEGLASSMGYPKTPPPKKIPILIEWYEPDTSAMDDMSADMFHYVQKGGLLKRPGPDARGWQKELLGPQFPRRGERYHQLTMLQGGEDAQHTGEGPSGPSDGRGDEG